MANYRDAKINDAVSRALSTLIGEVKDPRVSGSLISITGAKVSRDLKYATVYWSALGSDPERDREISAGLRSSAAFLRRRLASEVNLRETPELTFVKDSSFEKGARIESLLKKIEDNEKKSGEDGE
ncbi:MAG: 30S ribosome-binding factor RbfA [Clostridia bacterium]|nr:30S ribosome-binding factor RbfA [Clostridia bacterium]